MAYRKRELEGQQTVDPVSLSKRTHQLAVGASTWRAAVRRAAVLQDAADLTDSPAAPLPDAAAPPPAPPAAAPPGPVAVRPRSRRDPKPSNASAVLRMLLQRQADISTDPHPLEYLAHGLICLGDWTEDVLAGLYASTAGGADLRQLLWEISQKPRVSSPLLCRFPPLEYGCLYERIMMGAGLESGAIAAFRRTAPACACRRDGTQVGWSAVLEGPPALRVVRDSQWRGRCACGALQWGSRRLVNTPACLAFDCSADYRGQEPYLLTLAGEQPCLDILYVLAARLSPSGAECMPPWCGYTHHGSLGDHRWLALYRRYNN